MNRSMYRHVQFADQANEGINQNFQVATFLGVQIKSGILLVAVLLGAILGRFAFIGALSHVNNPMVLVFGLLVFPIITLVIYFIMFFKPITAQYLSIPYAALEGVSIAVMAVILEVFMGPVANNLVVLAFVITIALFLFALMLYLTGVVKVNNRFRSFALITIVSIIGFLFLWFIIDMISGGALERFLDQINQIFPMFGIILSCIMIIVAGVFAILSFDNAKQIVNRGIDKRYEWYAAFGIIIALIYMYWQVLRLLLRFYNQVRRR